jgi:putative PIN family toxin of toxin-antitoxin system
VTEPLRVVIDPNVWISALLSPAGAPADVVRAVLAGEVIAVVSPQLLDELGTVLARTKFRRWISPTDAEEFVRAIAAKGEPHADVPEPTTATRDRDDDYLVALAVSADARLVTGDDDLLSADLDPPALSPRALIGLLRPN